MQWRVARQRDAAARDVLKTAQLEDDKIHQEIVFLCRADGSEVGILILAILLGVVVILLMRPGKNDMVEHTPRVKRQSRAGARPACSRLYLVSDEEVSKRVADHPLCEKVNRACAAERGFEGWANKTRGRRGRDNAEQWCQQSRCRPHLTRLRACK